MELKGNKGQPFCAGLLAIAGLFFFWMTPANAADVRLAWDASLDAGVSGYAVYRGTSSGDHPERLDVGNQTAATVTNLTEGTTYFFVVVAYSAEEIESLPSNEVSYTVPLANQPPNVVAGEDQSVTLPAAVSLQGVVTDDGLPAGGLTTTWSVVSGAGTASFQDANALATPASFSTAGSYVIRLTANDGELNSFDELTVTVLPQPNQPPIVAAGADITITLPDTADLQGQATDDGLPSPANLATAWSLASGPGTVDFANPESPTTTTSFSVAGTYVLRLTATDGELSGFDELTVTVDEAPPVGKSVTLAWDPSPDTNVVGYAVYYGTNSGEHPIRVEAGAQTTCTISGLVEGVTYYFVVTACTADGMESVPSNEVSYTVPFDAPVNQAPIVVAGADQTVTLPATASLEGTVTDDGLPASMGLAIGWSVVSGSGTVEFANAGAAATEATFPSAGEYVLRLTASDGEFTSSSELTVTVLSQSLPDPAPEISELRMTPSGATLTWASVPDRTYRVVFKESLAATEWTGASPDIVATGDSSSWTDTEVSANPQRFYAILLLP